MTKIQLIRARRKLWEACTKHDGYQPFGYDINTLRITKPGLVSALQRLGKLYEKAN